VQAPDLGRFARRVRERTTSKKKKEKGENLHWTKSGRRKGDFGQSVVDVT